MKKVKVFLASSSELTDDRKEFELLINRKNKEWVDRSVFLELVQWEDFLDVLSQTRPQNEYNSQIRACDLFVMLFWTKVGRYTAEEFETAVGQFKATEKPFILVYFKDSPMPARPGNEADRRSLEAFQAKLAGLGHYKTAYDNVDRLCISAPSSISSSPRGSSASTRTTKPRDGDLSRPRLRTQTTYRAPSSMR